MDLRAGCPPVYEQKGLNSCSANAVAAAVEFDLMKQKNERVIFPSRLFIFYNARAMEGTTRSNEGVHIRDAVKSVARTYPPSRGPPRPRSRILRTKTS